MSYEPLLKEAIAEARAAGLEAAAGELEDAAFRTAYTTSSELIQEHGLAMRRFLKATRGALPASTRAKVLACLAQIQPGWRQLLSGLLRRRPVG